MSKFDCQIIYLLDGDQTGRLTAARLDKWAARAIEPTGTLAYVGADQLIVYVGPHSRIKPTKPRPTRARRKKPLADIPFLIFPDTLDVQTSVLGSRRVYYIQVAAGSEVTDITLAFVAGRISATCPADFRIVSNDKHAKHVCKLLAGQGFKCQMIEPNA